VEWRGGIEGEFRRKGWKGKMSRDREMRWREFGVEVERVRERQRERERERRRSVETRTHGTRK
jgi:hypothetical protein